VCEDGLPGQHGCFFDGAGGGQLIDRIGGRPRCAEAFRDGREGRRAFTIQVEADDFAAQEGREFLLETFIELPKRFCLEQGTQNTKSISSVCAGAHMWALYHFSNIEGKAARSRLKCFV